MRQVPVDLFVFTPEETRNWGDRFRREVELGVVLYERGANA